MSYARPRRAGVLGAIDDPMDDDYAADDSGGSSSDPRGAYVTWAATVKRYGGTVTAAPSSSAQLSAGMAAAKYPVAVIAPPPSGNLNPIFHAWPDLWTSSGQYGWYRAPASVLAYTNAQPRSFWDVGTWFGSSTPPIAQPQANPNEPAPVKPDWYTEMVTLLKGGGWILGGVAGLVRLSYLPRRRS
jgi:hypothetical protein